MPFSENIPTRPTEQRLAFFRLQVAGCLCLTARARRCYDRANSLWVGQLENEGLKV